MRMRAFARAFVVAIVSIISACGGPGGSSDRKVIKSTTVGSLTIALTSPAGALKSGDNELMITFEDSGKPLDVGAASLNFHMPAMGSMAEMNNKATLTTTNIPGWYRATVTLESGGTWEAQVKYQGPQGAGQASMTVNAK